MKGWFDLRIILVFLLSLFLTPMGHKTSAQDYSTLFKDFHASGLSWNDKRFLQAALAFEGHYNGLLDGDWGQLSQSALARFSRAEFGSTSEEWHMAFLALTFYQLYERDGWQIEYFEPMGMSMMVPSEAIAFDPATDTFVNFRHTQSSLSYSTGVHRHETAQNVHDFTLDWHELRTEPYSVRKPDFAVSRSERRDGSILYTRSNFVDGAWSTVMLSADRQDLPILNAVAASLSAGRSAGLGFTIGGRIDVALSQALEFLNQGESEPQSSDDRRFILVSRHGDLSDAIATAQTYQGRFRDTEVYETKSGFFALVVGTATLESVNRIIAGLVSENAVPSDAYATSGTGFTKRVWDVSIGETAPQNDQAPVPTPQPPRVAGSGTGFFVSTDGHVLTNEHVVDGCSRLVVDERDARILATSTDFDLAILKVEGISPELIARFSPSPAKLNSDVTVVGYPLSNLLSGLNVTRGAVSSQRGFQGDATRMQMTAPVQSGNSGGPVLAKDGEVVGVVVSKLDAQVVAEVTGDTPQNVNFAIRGEIAKLFLAQNGVDPLLGTSDAPLTPEDLAETGSGFTVFIQCEQ